MKRICLYSGNDLDGICSAAIVKHKYPDVELYPLEYHKIFDYQSVVGDGDEVIMVDYSITPFKNMDRLNDICDLTWIDHHNTSIDAYNRHISDNGKEISGVREVNRASCEMTWDLLFPDIHIPYTVWLLGRYDISRYDESQSIVPFQYGMKLHFGSPDDTEYWNKVFTENRDSRFIQDIIAKGNVIIQYRNTLNKRVCEMQTFESTLFGHRCVCMNRALCGESVFDSVYDEEKHDIMVTFYICAKGAWNVSLYTRKDINVGLIATKFGGGGYAKAAGFRCSLLPFEIAV